jgi:peptidoglycan/LPS O-acetylase OafA/YrhL
MGHVNNLKLVSDGVRLRRVRDFVLYIAIAVALAFGAIWSADHWHDVSHEAFLRWGGLGVNTLLLFGVAVYSRRSLVKRVRFWIVVAGLLVLHLSVFVLLLFKIVEHWSLFWFVLAYAPELVAVERILAYYVPRKYNRNRSSSPFA